MPVVVRFSEVNRYDINLDCEVVMMLGTTSTGSFWCEIPEDEEAPKRRKLFKERVVELIQEGLAPGQIEFSDS